MELPLEIWDMIVHEMHDLRALVRLALTSRALFALVRRASIAQKLRLKFLPANIEYLRGYTSFPHLAPLTYHFNARTRELTIRIGIRYMPKEATWRIPGCNKLRYIICDITRPGSFIVDISKIDKRITPKRWPVDLKCSSFRGVFADDSAILGFKAAECAWPEKLIGVVPDTSLLFPDASTNWRLDQSDFDARPLSA